MDLKIAWWNCHISAPATQAKPGIVTDEFVSIILTALDSGVDLFLPVRSQQSRLLRTGAQNSNRLSH